MTREETSIYFKNHTESFCVTGKCREAEKMAIKALEQELPTTKNNLGIDNQNIRLIDANALIKRLRPKHFDWWGEGEQDDFGKGNNSMLEEVIEAIEEFPSVTPQETKTGHWILTDVEGSKVWHCNCSKCNKDPLDFVGGSENWWLIKTKLPKYCPNCGAKMESEGKE